MAKKISQQDLRRLMQERKNAQSQQKQRIESPLAKYDEKGKLSCVLCLVQIKDESLWSSHLISKIHKEKIDQLKKKKLAQENQAKTQLIQAKQLQTQVKPHVRTEENILKRKLNQDEIVQPKIRRTENQIQESDEDDSEDSKSDERESQVIIESTEAAALPSDFFDVKPKIIENKHNQNENINENDNQNVINSNELPKGFFDDPMLDAKARNIQYKDPQEEEWEKFQKMIAEETKESEQIVDEEVEEIQVERTIQEIQDQIMKWSKINEYQKKAEEIQTKIDKIKGHEEMEIGDEDDDIDEDEINVFSNWRNKRVLN